MNSAKRRRLNDNNAAILSKPFRSPLKVNAKQSERIRIGKEKREQQESDTHDKCIVNGVDQQVPEHIESVLTRPEDVIQLQREYAALTQQLRRRRQILDTVHQALAIRNSKQSAKLDSLIQKWKLIARDVADEVFESTSAQIRDMGGLQAMQKHSQTFARDCFNTNEDSPSLRANDADDDVDVDSCDAGHAEDGTQSDVDECEYSMAVMLRQMNIDPDLLGFDQDRDEWCK